jgi:rod shape-determining protein MreC
MYRKQVRRRRAALVALIVASLVLISISFSEAEGGPVHSVQRGVSAVMAPVGEGADRALKPARDLVNWFGETFDARGDNERLRSELAELRSELADAQAIEGAGEQLRGLAEVSSREELAGFEPVTARVIVRSPTVWYSTVTVDKGRSAGVEVNDPVVNPDGLIGRVTDVTRGSAQVTLITDPRSAVSARVLPNGPSGIIEPEVGNPDDLLLQFIDGDQDIEQGQIIVTAGWGNEEIASAFPFGIEIGRVSEAEAGERQAYQHVRVRPFADLRDLDLVQVLTGGPRRPGVPG